jgi:single-stranded DNA-binding protein
MFYNNSVFVGRMTADPRFGEHNGRKYVQFSLAVGRPYTNKETGERPVDYPDVVFFGDRLATMIAEGGKKGRLVMVSGELRSRIRTVGETKVKDWTLYGNVIRWLDTNSNKKEQHELSEETVEEPVDADDIPF